MTPHKSILFFHQNRQKTKLNKADETYYIYHDSFSGNQDPYIWNTNFLYSFCKIKDVKPTTLNIGDIIYFIDKQTISTQDGEKILYKCDLVFYIKQIFKWKTDKNIPLKNKALPYLDKFTYANHYYWAIFDHIKPTKRSHTRITFIAHETYSFQPQNSITNDLVDITEEIESIFGTKEDNTKKVNTKIFDSNDSNITNIYNKTHHSNGVCKYIGKDLADFKDKATINNWDENFIDVLDFEYEKDKIKNLIYQLEDNVDYILLDLDDIEVKDLKLSEIELKKREQKINSRRETYNYLLLAIKDTDTLSNKSVNLINRITQTRHYFIRPVTKTSLLENKRTISICKEKQLISFKKNKIELNLDDINLAFINFTRDIEKVNILLEENN